MMADGYDLIEQQATPLWRASAVDFSA